MRSLVFAVVLAALVPARPGRAAPAYPDAYALRPLELPQGLVQLKVPVVVNLSRGQVARPVWIPFELRLGLTEALELRLFHPVHGLCVSGRARGCGRVYNDLGVGILYSVVRDQGMDLALLAAFEVTSFSNPVLLRLDAGMAWKLVHAPFSIAAWPYIGLGLDHRDQNGDSLNVPIEFAFQLSPRTALFIETGIFGALHGFGDAWSMPLGVGVNYLAAHGLDLGAEFKLTGPVGNGGNGDIDGRIFLAYLALRN